MTDTPAPNDMPDLKWTKKPVTIEAWQLTEEVALNYWENKILPPFGCKSISGEYNKNTKVVRDAYFHIDTLEGFMKASLGDWIIKGVKGEIYPCKPDIFEATYIKPNLRAPVSARGEVLKALDLLRLRAYSHADKSNGPKEMREWIDADVETILAALQQPPAPAVDLEKLLDVIGDTLRHHRLSFMQDEDNGGYPLIDALTYKGRTVQDGIEEIEHILDELAAPLKDHLAPPVTAPIEKVDGWQPIESAPEGKDILVYCRETGECFVVFWALQIETRKGDWVIARAKDGTCFICKNPTHWLPLPAAPKAEGA